MKKLFFVFVAASILLVVACSSNKKSTARSGFDTTQPLTLEEHLLQMPTIDFKDGQVRIKKTDQTAIDHINKTQYTIGGIGERTVDRTDDKGHPVVLGTVKLENYQSRLMTDEPLFVINGKVVEGGFKEANKMAAPESIKSVRLVKRQEELSRYGVEGHNGVIKIRLRNVD